MDKKDSASTQAHYSAPAASKLLDILEVMATASEGFSLSELSRRLSISLNSTFRICRVLEERGYIVRDQSSGLLSLTSKLYALGARVGDRVDLISHVRPYLQWLTETTKENAHFCVLRDDHLLLLDQTISMHPVRVVVDTGSLLFPHASAFGKVILAFLPAKEQEPLLAHQWPQLTPHTKNDPAELSAELQTIQSCGIAYDLEEYQIG
ncbi:MAG TPA: IclR family transcriptional regulator, partial [Armatimonadota bacterium]|nr:IclR family transcriptional regulator [Armatimonadota bacterium]